MDKKIEFTFANSQIGATTTNHQNIQQQNQENNIFENNFQVSENDKKTDLLEKYAKSAKEMDILNQVFDSVSSESITNSDIKNALASSAFENAKPRFEGDLKGVNEAIAMGMSQMNNAASTQGAQQRQELSPNAKAALADLQAKDAAREEAIKNGQSKETELADGGKEVEVTYTYNGVTYTETQRYDSSGTSTYSKQIGSDGSAKMGFLYTDPKTGERLWQSNTGDVINGKVFWHIPYRHALPIDHPERANEFGIVPDEAWPKD